MYTEIGANGIDVYMSKLFMISYADYIVLFANSAGDLQFNLDILSHYCQRWKLLFNKCTSKTKVIVFRKSGRLSNDIKFSYNDMDLESVDKFVYLGLVFTIGGSLALAQNTLAVQSLKAIFKLSEYLYRLTNIILRHKLENIS